MKEDRLFPELEFLVEDSNAKGVKVADLLEEVEMFSTQSRNYCFMPIQLQFSTSGFH